MTGRKRWPFAVAAIAAHVALVAAVPAFEQRAPPAVIADELSLEVELEDESEPDVPELTVIPPGGPSAPLERGASRLRGASIATTVASITTTVASSEEIRGGDTGETLVALEPETDRTPSVDLAPSAVARAWLPMTGEPSRPRAAAAEGDEPVDERALEAAISSDLRGRAMTKAYVSSHVIELRARPDGSYVHRGNGFVATIQPDGSVDFDDRAGARVDGPAAMTIDPRGRILSPDGSLAVPELLTAPGGLIETIEPPPIIFGMGGTFDLQGELMRAGGQDPWQAERQRFLDETEALRDELTDRHAARLRERALRRPALRR